MEEKQRRKWGSPRSATCGSSRRFERETTLLRGWSRSQEKRFWVSSGSGAGEGSRSPDPLQNPTSHPEVCLYIKGFLLRILPILPIFLGNSCSILYRLISQADWLILTSRRMWVGGADRGTEFTSPSASHLLARLPSVPALHPADGPLWPAFLWQIHGRNLDLPSNPSFHSLPPRPLQIASSWTRSSL